jgi:peroxiredoxin family protein
MSEEKERKLSLIVFSGDFDKLLAAFVLATGAKAMAMDASMFFTFWGLAGLRDGLVRAQKKTMVERAFAVLLPKGEKKTKLSKLNMGGMGPKIFRHVMKTKGIASLAELIAYAAELGVKIYLCEMSMTMLGFKAEEMISYPNISICGVATFLGEAEASSIQLFI